MRAKEYRKKPVVIEAVQWTGENMGEILGFFGGAAMREGQDIIIGTLEGEMRAMPGDWIIKGVKGEFYPCKPDIFAATYEDASGPSAPPAHPAIDYEDDALDGVLFRFWCRAASYPGGWPSAVAKAIQNEQAAEGYGSPSTYRRALMKLAHEKGVNLPHPNQGVSLRITGPNSDGEYWLHLKNGNGPQSGGINLGSERRSMIVSALLKAAAGGAA